MAPSSSVQFIDTALSCTCTPYVLSYPDPKQKRIIRKHLLSLLNEYPTFKPFTDTFIHNNGTAVYLLNAGGNLRVAGGHKYTPPVPLVIWLHENYPYMPPIVFVSSCDSISPIHHNHPFVDSYSGAVSSPYLQTWIFPRCNLTDLVHNLAKIFSHDHPFISSSPSSSCCFTHDPCHVSKMEALDRLWGMIHYDMIAFKTMNEKEMEELSVLKAELLKRKDVTSDMIANLEQEKLSLKKRVMELVDEADVVMNWLRVNDVGIEGDGIDDAFEGEDEESRLVIDCLAADKAAEDLIYALARAAEEGVLPVDAYIRQVRTLAREQFLHRAVLVKLRGPDILFWA